MDVNGISFGNKKTLTTIIEGRNLTPLCKHKGPILELTPEEDELVKKISHKRDIYHLEVLNLIQIKRNKKNAMKQDAFNKAVDTLEYEIEKLNDWIKEIKMNRYRIQKAEYERVNGKNMITIC